MFSRGQRLIVARSVRRKVKPADDQHRSPNTNNKDHLVGQLTSVLQDPFLISSLANLVQIDCCITIKPCNRNSFPLEN